MLPLAAQVLTMNKQFCIEETLAFITTQSASQTGAWAGFPQTATSVEFCRRDVTFVIEAYIDGLNYETNKSMLFIGSRYWKGKVSSLVGNKQKEIEAHTFLKELILNYVFTNIEFLSNQATEIQYISEDIIESGALSQLTTDFEILTSSILNGPQKLLLHNFLETRYTAKWWDPKPVEQSKLETILECAYQAPSKQGYHEFEIHVITDSPEGKEFKQWLYWDNTSCLNKVRGAQGPGLRRYNGQVLAPVLLIWLAKKYSAPVNAFGESDWLRTNTDCTVSSTMAMCQAEELGLATGFCGTLGGVEIAQRLNRPNHIATLSMGVGYATPDRLLNRVVYKDGVEMGFDLSNLSPQVRSIDSRKKRPAKQAMINYM